MKTNKPIEPWQCCEVNPKDRDYNKHGLTRQETVQLEIGGRGICQTLRSAAVVMVIVEDE